MKLGLTGSIACGKSTVSAYLASLGCAIVDADAISRTLTADGGAALPAVRQAFGDGVFCGDSLDRRALGQLVFSDSQKRDELNSPDSSMPSTRRNALSSATSRCSMNAACRRCSMPFGSFPFRAKHRFSDLLNAMGSTERRQSGASTLKCP